MLETSIEVFDVLQTASASNPFKSEGRVSIKVRQASMPLSEAVNLQNMLPCPRPCWAPGTRSAIDNDVPDISQRLLCTKLGSALECYGSSATGTGTPGR